jgi:outer membrane protein assembly factor BamD (BamD/ComL family)
MLKIRSFWRFVFSLVLMPFLQHCTHEEDSAKDKPLRVLYREASTKLTNKDTRHRPRSLEASDKGASWALVALLDEMPGKNAP